MLRLLHIRCTIEKLRAYCTILQKSRVGFKFSPTYLMAKYCECATNVVIYTGRVGGYMRPVIHIRYRWRPFLSLPIIDSIRYQRICAFSSKLLLTLAQNCLPMFATSGRVISCYFCIWMVFIEVQGGLKMIESFMNLKRFVFMTIVTPSWDTRWK